MKMNKFKKLTSKPSFKNSELLTNPVPKYIGACDIPLQMSSSQAKGITSLQTCRYSENLAVVLTSEAIFHMLTSAGIYWCFG